MMGPVPHLLGVTAALSLLPDVDSALGLFLGNFGRYHNNGTHSLLAGLLVALGIGIVVQVTKRSKFTAWFATSLLCYELHVLMDYFTFGRGVMLFWPLSLERFAPPFKLFYGVRWSHGWLSTEHVWTLVTEAVFALGSIVLAGMLTKSKVAD